MHTLLVSLTPVKLTSPVSATSSKLKIFYLLLVRNSDTGDGVIDSGKQCNAIVVDTGELPSGIGYFILYYFIPILFYTELIL
jgi:hypothetical protein